jgi:hypothetical protein
MNRRRFIYCLAVFPFTASADSMAENPLAGMTRRGTAEFRRYGFLIYEATLWALGNNPTIPPLALKLTYKRNIKSEDIVGASVDEIRHLGIADETQLNLWRTQMAKIFPDVRPGDHILGLYLDDGAQFFYNDKFIGSIENTEFARAFFGIWLNENTSAPSFRSALLKVASS